MNTTTLLSGRLKRLLIIGYLLFLAFESMAVPLQSSFLSETAIEKQLMTFDKRSEVTTVTFSPNGHLIAYGSKDNKVYLWNVDSGKLLKTFEGHTHSVTAVAFSANGLKLASSSKDKTIRIWDINTKTFLKKLEGHTDVVNSVVFHPKGNRLASGSQDKTIRLWETSGNLFKKFKWGVHSIKTVAFSPNGQLLATGSTDLKVRLWNANTLEMYQPRMKCTKYQHVASLDFNPNNNLLASGYRHGMVCIWDTSSRELIKQLSTLPKKDALSAVTFSANGKKLAYSRYDKIYLWHINTENPVELLTVRNNHYIHTIDFNPNIKNDNILVYGSNDGAVHLWDIDNNKRVGIFVGNADGKWLSCVKQHCLCSGKPCSPLTSDVSNNLSNTLSKSSTSVKIEANKSDNKESRTLSKLALTEPRLVPDDLALNEPRLMPDDSGLFESMSSDSFVEADEKLSDNVSIYFIIILFVIILFVISAIVVMTLLYRRFLCKKYAALLTTPLSELPQQYKLLKYLRCLTKVLSKNQIPAKSLEEAVVFVQNWLPAEQAEILATRLDAHCESTTQHFFTVYLPDNFPLNLQTFGLYFPTPAQNALEILNQLHQQTTIQKVVIISINPEQQRTLRTYGKDSTTLNVVPNDVELTNWLLSPTPILTFTQILTEQLQLAQISPYQTRGGINKDTIFFGRTQILDRILNSDPANYLIVGGRQLGKSSLIKYIYRHYQNHPQVQCHYLTLHSDNIQGQLAVTLGLPSDSDEDSLLNRLIEITHKKRGLLLIDQADQLIQAENKNGYRILNHFRSLSEEGNCHFILTGFWDLYHASVLDYQSPLKNFGETIKVSALEADACRDLAIQPMKIMHLRYANETLIENLLAMTGQRANLIAIICHEMLKKLKSQQHILAEEDMQQAFNSDAVRDALKGWNMLSVNETDNRLDRIIVYATLQKGEFNLTEIMNLLETYHCTYTAEQVKQSLDRLALSFVIKRSAPGQYKYCVPLFRQVLLEENVDGLLQWELKEAHIEQEAQSSKYTIL